MKQPTLADLKRISELDTTTTTVTSMANLRRAVAIAEREAGMVDRLVEILKRECLRTNAHKKNCDCETCKLLTQVAEMRNQEAGE